MDFPVAGKKLCSNRVHKFGQGSEQHGGSENILRVFDRGMQPLLIATVGLPNKYASRDAGDDAEKHFDGRDGLPVIDIFGNLHIERELEL